MSVTLLVLSLSLAPGVPAPPAPARATSSSAAHRPCPDGMPLHPAAQAERDSIDLPAYVPYEGLSRDRDRDLAALDSDRPEIRRPAARRLSRLGKPADFAPGLRALLLRHLSHPDPVVRASMAEALGEGHGDDLGDMRAVLIAHLEHERDSVVRYVVLDRAITWILRDGMERCGPIVEAALRCIDDPEGDVRARATRILKLTYYDPARPPGAVAHDPRIVRALLGRLQDTSVMVLRYAIDGLEWVHPPPREVLPVVEQLGCQVPGVFFKDGDDRYEGIHRHFAGASR